MSEFYTYREEIERLRDNITFLSESGLPLPILTEGFNKIAEHNKPKMLLKAELMAYLFDNAQLELSPHDRLADRINHGSLIDKLRCKWASIYSEHFGSMLAETARANARGAYSGFDDFGHTCPDWNSLLTLGIPGVLKRLEESEKSARNEHSRLFYESCAIVYRALIRLLGRYADLADKLGVSVMAENLRSVAVSPPHSLYEAMQITAIIYRLQTHVEDVPVRSLGRIDKLYLPFVSDSILCSNSDYNEKTRELFRYFLTRFNDKFIGANIPFTLGGVDIASDPKIEALDLLILDEYGKLDIPSPKIQIRIAENTPRSVIDKALALIRSGSNSIVFCNDRTVIAGLIQNGHTLEDARNYVMIGCYEPSTMGMEAACTCNGRVSLAKAVECALNGGRDLQTGEHIGPKREADFANFDEFFNEVKHQAEYFALRSIECTKALETCYPEVNTSPLQSGSMSCCIESGRDVYEGGARYNYSSINVFGTATAADSLVAIKRLVFEEKSYTFAELREILRSDWKDNEKLRLICKTRFPKYGNGDAEVDSLALELMSATVAVINGAPNGRGGKFRAGAFSIDWRFEYGRVTAASADGRHTGETLSKNLGACDSCDKGGVTAMITSACCLDATALSNGAVLDLTLHPTAVSGEDGLDAMRGLMSTYMRKGGFAVQFNVLDPAVLRRAQTEPEKYSTLQVRLCGWNVYFVNLSRIEQDEFIRSAEA